MVTKYKTEDVKPDKKCANNGTLNYIALDGHLGSKMDFNLWNLYYIHFTSYKIYIYFLVHTRRGDLESLMYNGLEWLKLKLPWKNLTLPKTIKSKSEVKDAILTARPNSKIYDFNNVPNCKYLSQILLTKKQKK